MSVIWRKEERIFLEDKFSRIQNIFNEYIFENNKISLSCGINFREFAKNSRKSQKFLPQKYFRMNNVKPKRLRSSKLLLIPLRCLVIFVLQWRFWSAVSLSLHTCTYGSFQYLFPWHLWSMSFHYQRDRSAAKQYHPVNLVAITFESLSRN